MAQILIFYAKSRWKMNGIWQKDIPSKFARDWCLAESCWLFSGCGMVVCGGGGRFPLTKFLCFHPSFHAISHETRDCCTTWCPSR